MKEMNKKNNPSAKSLKAGGYSVAITAILLAALVFINLIVSMLPSDIIKFDTTAKKYFTLDKQTEEILASVNEDITVYHIAQSGMELDELTELLGRYTSKNSRIKVKTVDPAVSPGFIEQYTEEALEDNSLIVVSDKRVKVVPYGEIIYPSYDNITEEEYYNYIYYGIMPQGESIFAGENAITSAIDHVTATDIPTVYALTGHGEVALSDAYLGYVKDENFVYSTLSLIASASGEDLGISSGLVQGSVSVPEDADCVLINAPTSDITDAELDALLAFVRGGGTIVVNADYKTVKRPNLVKLAAALGLDVCGALVVEGSQGYYTQRAYYLLPQPQTHAITDPIIEGGKYVLAAYSHAMKKLETLPEDVKSVTPLLLTSSNAVGKVDPDSTKAYFEDGDMLGQFIGGAAVEIGDGKAVWYASSYIADDSANNMVSGGNSDLLLNTLGWCCDKGSSVSIRTISLSIQPLTITEGASTAWLVVVCVLIPLAFVGLGFAVWFRRRSK